MARETANIRIDMWRDREWRSLSLPAQHLYMYLLSSPSLDYAGVADWRPNRIAALTEGVTTEMVIAASEELQGKAFIYADESTEEVFIRSFVKHDGLLRHPRIPVAMAKAFANISSTDIQDYFIHELVKAKEREPDLKCWNNPKVSSLLGLPSRDLQAEASPNPSVDSKVLPFGSPSVTHPSACSTATATATATSTDVDGGGSGRKRPSKPLPQAWEPTATHREKAQELGVDLEKESEKFKNHHLAKDSRFSNWNAAFSNWLTKAKEFQPKLAVASGQNMSEEEARDRRLNPWKYQ